jgi:dolichol-phosphate mannosyltransferase
MTSVIPFPAPSGSAGVARWPEIAIVVPTLNERDNVSLLAQQIAGVLGNTAYEILFVDDDSKDGTPDVVADLSRSDPRVRIIRRIGRRGLASAVIEGALASTAPFIVVMDADLQHDASILPAMLSELRSGKADVVVGSRYVEGGGVGEWSKGRERASRLATKAAHLLTRANLTDPMSGYFAITRPAFESAMRRTSNQGFKILLDLLSAAPKPLRVVEIPYTFGQRLHGDSKLDTLIILEFGAMLLSKMLGNAVPVRFIMFMAVGGLGVFVHMGILALSINVLKLEFLWAQTVAVMCAMTFNFVLNNFLTYRDKRLKGFWPVIGGLLSFYLACSIGAVANVGIANYLVSGQHYNWWLSGIAGVLVGAVWNFAVSSVFTWRKS